MNKTIMIRKKKVFLGILVILMIGIVYEQIAEYFDNAEYKPIGRIINVKGHNMHIFGKGNGSATVVFTSGWRTPSPYVDLYPLYNEISKYTRIVVYDRPGYGWSDVSNSPRDIDTITKEIHELLEKSGEKPPYILVGHSIGSFEVLRFTQLHKNEVKGVILIDGLDPNMYPTAEKPSIYDLMFTSIFNNLVNVANKTGIIRLLFIVPSFYSPKIFSFRNRLSLAPEDLKKLDEVMFLKTLNNRSQIDEDRNKEVNAFRVASSGNINDVPLRIITSEELNNYQNSKESQLNLKKWSTDSKQIIVKDSRHYIHWFHPEVINNEILDILNNEWREHLENNCAMDVHQCGIGAHRNFGTR